MANIGGPTVAASFSRLRQKLRLAQSREYSLSVQGSMVDRVAQALEVGAYSMVCSQSS